ncbi:MAG TPA: UTP--glucose-1-phosphate uridylyltransferase [Acidobacteriota bacterium]|nr:UTP--glucose-1-phosphate uridylyltransferase [Acidobacteriota bacterium]
MNSQLVDIITSQDPEVRNRSLDAICRGAQLTELLSECEALEAFCHASDNLYERVRALFFLYAIHRFHLPGKSGATDGSLIPFEGYVHLLQRRFEEAIGTFLAVQQRNGPSEGISSALSEAYRRLGFQTLADQVRRSVRSVRGNQWMFRVGHPMDQPLRVRDELLERSSDGLFPILHEATPVRMDLSHSAWSDIFLLGMDFPEGARVLNVSIDLAVRGRDPVPRPPVEAFFRVIDEPVLRLVSVDLNASAEIASLAEVFDFARDYLGLLKAAVIAGGIVPPGIEGSGERLEDLLSRLAGVGRGIELVSRVNGIPKGSRLAVSTSLLASLIAVCMRATGQAATISGPLQEHERRLVAARAILGEWLAGSGGGWQDSGGVWPDMKLITGVKAGPEDPEYGISQGRLLPAHHIIGVDEVSSETRRGLQDSLVLVHGGMAQNVGPILEMVTEKYLLRSEAEWLARRQACGILDEILDLLRHGNIQGVGEATTRNFFGPIQTIIPRASTLYTELLIDQVRAEFGERFWGFWMLGGASGGGMGFIFDPAHREHGKERVHEIMLETKRRLKYALPFAIEPVVYDFSINTKGSCAELLTGKAALMPPDYYTLTVPGLLRRDPTGLALSRRAELNRFGAACRTEPELAGTIQSLFDRIIPRAGSDEEEARSLDTMLGELGFDRVQHEQIRSDLRSGRIGLSQNRLPPSTDIRDPDPQDVIDAQALPNQDELRSAGLRALQDGAVAVVTLAAGVGSRWTEGAGVVKALNPFCRLSGKHRTFIEIHLAKSRRVGRECGRQLPHVITTSYLTHQPIREFLADQDNYGYPGRLILSTGASVGLRLVPTTRDLRFAWEEMPQQLLDEQAQKVRESLHSALIAWARQTGEANDYRDNVPMQCLHPVGHWFEIPNLFKNGVLAQLVETQPGLQVLLMHNIDTVGMDVDPALLALHLQSEAAMTVEVIRRRMEDRGGGLARADGQLRLIEGLAMPREEDEFRLSYYNSNTMWINIDKILAAFGLTRDDLRNRDRVSEAVRALAARMPTYVTLKDVKRRWGYGQEDVLPVAQFEKLWGDMTALPGLDCRFVEVSRLRGQQLKEVAQLDGWLRDGSAEYVNSLCAWK